MPVALINPPVSKLPPVMLALTLTVVPVCVVALTLAPPKTFPPTRLPVADTIPPVLMLPPVALPVTVKLVNVPTEVILVCAAVVSVPTMLVPDRLPPVMLPVTAKLVNVPTEVMLVCAAVVKVPTILVPDRLPPVMLPVADINPPVSKLPLVVMCWAEPMSTLSHTQVPLCQ